MSGTNNAQPGDDVVDEHVGLRGLHQVDLLQALDGLGLERAAEGAFALAFDDELVDVPPEAGFAVPAIGGFAGADADFGLIEHDLGNAAAAMLGVEPGADRCHRVGAEDRIGGIDARGNEKLDTKEGVVKWLASKHPNITPSFL